MIVKDLVRLARSGQQRVNLPDAAQDERGKCNPYQWTVDESEHGASFEVMTRGTALRPRAEYRNNPHTVPRYGRACPYRGLLPQHMRQQGNVGSHPAGHALDRKQGYPPQGSNFPPLTAVCEGTQQLSL